MLGRDDSGHTKKSVIKLNLPSQNRSHTEEKIESLFKFHRQILKILCIPFLTNVMTS